MARVQVGSALLDTPADFGHAYHRRNARIVLQTRLGASQGMELTDIADIDNPEKRDASVRVARRIDPLIAILGIQPPPRSNDPDAVAQLKAAEEFRRHAAIADGIRPMPWAGFISSGADGQTPAQLLLDAQSALRRAWTAIRGPENNASVADVVRLIVLGYQTLQVVENARRCRHGAARILLNVGLERLTEHFGLA